MTDLFGREIFEPISGATLNLFHPPVIRPASEPIRPPEMPVKPEGGRSMGWPPPWHAEDETCRKIARKFRNCITAEIF